MKELLKQEPALRTAVPPGLTGDIFKDTELVEAKVHFGAFSKIFHIFLGERSLPSSKSWGGPKREAETGTDDKGLKDDKNLQLLNFMNIRALTR